MHTFIAGFHHFCDINVHRMIFGVYSVKIAMCIEAK